MMDFQRSRATRVSTLGSSLIRHRKIVWGAKLLCGFNNKRKPAKHASDRAICYSLKLIRPGAGIGHTDASQAQRPSFYGAQLFA